MTNDVLLVTGNYTWAGIRGDYTRVTFSFHIRRKPRYYIINLITPCCLLSFVTAAAFILPSSCSERLGISTSINQSSYTMLVACTQRVHRTPGLPPTCSGHVFHQFDNCACGSIPIYLPQRMTLAATRRVSRFLMCPKMHL